MPALTAQNHEVRARNIAASEVGALLGHHPYATPEGIFDRLTGAGRPVRVNEAMELGSFFEAPILRFAERRDGFRARLNKRTLEHPAVRLCATVDAFVTKPGPWVMVPERALVEIKMSGAWWTDLPPHIEAQVRAQLACADRDVAYVYALLSQRLLRFEVIRDAEKEAHLLERVQRFWTDHIVPGVRPSPEPTQPSSFIYEGI